MKTKIIPFDLELAKKIQAGEIKGRIVAENIKGILFPIRIICYNSKNRFPIVGLAFDPSGNEYTIMFGKSGTNLDNVNIHIELLEEALEEQHPIEESELYQSGYKVGFEADRCVAFDEKKGCAIKKEELKHDDVEEVLTGDGSIVFLRHKKHEFQQFDKVLVRDTDKGYWRASFFSHISGDWYVCVGDEWRQCIPYEGNEHLLGTTDKPKEE